ncbi:FAD-dependent monooxygenase [Nocardia sp. CDC159]|uniref:FAD-dependent monooxygenase n=1 Tax=Nocardia pulmonis TaxID=2951408 RepID=A0A9X2E9Y4_9NOCA|nr:FAD-dependent monooxygenase [Nocardia pulmonis]MCM6788903.1 FAD-dependent monooxygenase [Nocardia sp. CDC159]
MSGQALAYWLVRHGFRPTVVERTVGPRRGGQGVDVRDQAIDVAERMGILQRLRAVATHAVGLQFVDADDRAIARIDVQNAQQRNGGGNVEVMRADLVRILHDITSGTVEYRFDDAVRAVAQDPDGVTVDFVRGARRRFDLVVGADGLHSAIRRLAFGPEDAFVHHMGCYVAFGTADAALGRDRWTTAFNVPGRMAAIYRPGGDAQAMAYFLFRSPRLDLDHHDPVAVRSALAAAFGDVHAWRVPELLAGALADPELYFDSLSRVRMDSWSTGRVVLAGDAAHCASPASGAGTELALIGAYRLAGELAVARGDHRLAFPRYEQAHRPLVHRKQQVGPNLLRLTVPKTRLGMAVRNTVIRLPLLESLAGLERLMAPRTITPLPGYRPDGGETRGA